MHPEFTALDQRKLRVALLQELAAAFQEAQPAIVMSNMKHIQQHTTRQHELCRALLQLGEAKAELPPVDQASQTAWRHLSQELAEIQPKVRHLGRVQTALLRRSRRAMEALACLLTCTALTYTLPSSGSAR